MTTLTINIPDSNLDLISNISSLVKNAGGEISVHSDNESKTEELRAELKQSLHEVFDIIEGKTPRKTLKDVLNG